MPPLAALVLALAPLAAQEDGVVETHHPNGAVDERYEVDGEGRRDGDYTRFRPDGSVAVEAVYRDDRLHGRYVERDEEGAVAVEALYRSGRRHGAWREYEGGELVLSATYRRDVLDGPWRRVEPDGSLVVETRYRRGAIHGRYEESRPLEGWTRVATYDDGVLDGRARIVVGRTTVSEREWDDGRLVDLDGIVPYPVPLDALGAELAEARVLGALDPDDPLSRDRETALARLKTYRALCRLPWRHLELDPEWNALCDAAGAVCSANGRLSHTPERPEGMDEDLYRRGYEGASNSNLSGGGLARSVDAYMDDSDPTNIDRIGHRRWCLNPALGRTGFGAHGNWAAMWTMDSSGPGARGLDAVLYPPAGYVPVDLFGPRHAWSIQLLAGRVPNDDDLEVTVVALDGYHRPHGEPLELDWRAMAGGGYGGSPCVVFRPVGVRVEPGARYRTTVSLDGGRSVAFDYVVEFVAAPERGR